MESSEILDEFYADPVFTKPKPGEAEIAGLHDITEIIGENTPELPEALIENVMRVGGVMSITAASKAGKSMLTYELTIALASGWKWLGHQCKESKVLYCDFENDWREGGNRFEKIRNYYGLDAESFRGKVFPFYPEGDFIHDYNKILPLVEAIAKDKGVDVIVLDSTYNLLGGLDENAAGDIAVLFAAIKSTANVTGCSIVLVHHFSKGSQSGKSSMDRGSGSGVFARAPSAILSIDELEMTDELIERANMEYEIDMSDAIPFKIEMTLRSFKRPEPTYGFYLYPIHLVDTKGVLKDARTMDVVRAAELRENVRKSRGKDYSKVIPEAYQTLLKARGLEYGEPVDMYEMAKALNVSEKTLINNMKMAGFRKQGGWMMPE